MDNQFEHNLVRHVAVRPSIAFAWMTDYREDDARWVFDDERGTRTFERLDPTTLHVRTVARFAGIRTTMDLEVRLQPPDSWRAEGDLKTLGVRMLRQQSTWTVAPDGGDGTVFTASFVLTPANALARLFLALFGGRIRRELDATYDRIATALTTAPRLTSLPQLAPGLRAGEEPA